MPTDLERLSVLIEANTKSYERAMLRMQAQTEKAMRGAGKSIGGLNKQFAAVSSAAQRMSGLIGVSLGVGAFKQFASAIAATVQRADDLQDLADKIGLTAENLQELQYQAKVSGSNAEDLNAALDQFTKRIGEAAQGGGALLKVLKDHGIALRDQAGNLRPITDLLADYADAIKNASSDAERLALAQEAFKNTDMASVFRNGAAGIREMGDEAHRTGQIISNDVVKALADMQPELDRLQGAWSVAWANISLLTLQALEKIGQAEHFILDPVIDAINSIDTKAGHLEHLRKMQQAGQLPRGYQVPFPGKEADDQTLLPPPAAKKAATIAPATIQRLNKSFNEIKTSGAGAASSIRAVKTETAAAVEPTHALAEEQRDLIDRMDEIRNAAGGALDAFASSIQNAEGPLKAMKAALEDVLQTIIRIAEQKFITSLFGAFGTAGGGFFGGLSAPALAVAGGGRSRSGGGQMNVHITASPSPLLDLKITKAMRAAEDRAVARGPAVASNNNRRFATP